MVKFELDLAMFQETGVNWSIIPGQDQFQTRLDSYFEPGQRASYMGYNKHDITGNLRQWGGTGVMAHGKLKHFCMGAGADKSNLGRWTWARY